MSHCCRGGIGSDPLESERSSQAFEAFAAAADVGADVDPDLAGIDQVDVDAALGEGGEHAGGDAGVGAHADADDRELGEGGLDGDVVDAGRLDGLDGAVGRVRGAR